MRSYLQTLLLDWQIQSETDRIQVIRIELGAEIAPPRLAGLTSMSDIVPTSQISSDEICLTLL